MASSTSNSKTRPKLPGFIANAKKFKESYFQLFLMTGIFFLSIKSLGQKYYIRELQQDNASLKDEHSSNLQRFHQIQQDLLHEASLDTTGRFGTFLGALFADQSSE